MMHDKLDALRASSVTAAASHEAARAHLDERRAATAAIVARLDGCAPTIEAHNVHFAEEDMAREREWAAHQAAIVAENAAEFAARLLQDAEETAERKRLDAEAVARHTEIAARGAQALDLVLRVYAPAARGIAVLIKTEAALFDDVERLDRSITAWPNPRFRLPPALTNPRFLGMLTLPNLTEPDYNYGHYWYPQYQFERLRDVAPRADIRDVIIKTAIRSQDYDAAEKQVAVAAGMLREEYARLCREIVEAMGAWERAKCDLLQWNSESGAHVHLELESLVVPDILRSATRDTTPMIKSMAGRIFLPALGDGEAFWNWNWPVRRSWEG